MSDANVTDSNTMPHQLPLANIRVLDATHIVAGPFCSQILADMGAEVIKIERPRTGDLVRGRGPYVTAEDGQRISSRYIGLNRNKKSVTLDLRNARCKAAFEEMVKVSDVLLDNWGPGAFARLGLGYERLRELNPGLVYASITGYGDSDDLRGPYSDWPANNLAIQGMAGWMELTGEPGRPPQSVGDNIGDSIPGVWAALGIVLALRSREQTGQGQHVDMAMYECMVAHTLSNMYGYEATGEVFTRDWSRLANAGITFRASDGYVIMAGARVPERWRNLWRLVGRDDLADNPDYLAPGDGEFIHDQVIPALENGRSSAPSGRWPASLPNWASLWAWPRPSKTWPTAPNWRQGICSWKPATPPADGSAPCAPRCACWAAPTSNRKRLPCWARTTGSAVYAGRIDRGRIGGAGGGRGGLGYAGNGNYRVL